MDFNSIWKCVLTEICLLQHVRFQIQFKTVYSLNATLNDFIVSYILKIAQHTMKTGFSLPLLHTGMKWTTTPFANTRLSSSSLSKVVVLILVSAKLYRLFTHVLNTSNTRTSPYLASYSMQDIWSFLFGGLLHHHHFQPFLMDVKCRSLAIVSFQIWQCLTGVETLPTIFLPMPTAILASNASMALSTL